MSLSQEIAKELEKKGWFLSVAEVQRITGIDRRKINELLVKNQVKPCGKNTGKVYWYRDIAKALSTY